MDVLADMLKSDSLTARPDAPAAKEAEAPQEGTDPFASLFAKGKRSKWVNFPDSRSCPSRAQSRRRAARSRHAAAHRAMAARIDTERQRRRDGLRRAGAEKEMGAFSDIALQQMLRQDIKPLESVMQTLAEQIKACSFTAQAKGAFFAGCSAARRRSPRCRPLMKRPSPKSTPARTR